MEFSFLLNLFLNQTRTGRKYRSSHPTPGALEFIPSPMVEQDQINDLRTRCPYQLVFCLILVVSPGTDQANSLGKPP